MEKNFATYEYVTKTVKAGKQTAEIDMREAFGWEATETTTNVLGDVTISFKRDRKIAHKAELNRLERKADGIKKAIEELEKSKTKKATVVASTVGTIGALILGGGMSLALLKTANIPLLITGIALGVVGIAVCAINYFKYPKMVAKKTEQLTPSVEENEEKLATICEQAHELFAKETV